MCGLHKKIWRLLYDISVTFIPFEAVSISLRIHTGVERVQRDNNNLLLFFPI